MADSSPASLRRQWQLSLALDLEHRFLSDLPAAPAKDLARLLGEELLAAADRLDVLTDARLSLFAAGQEDALGPAAVIHLHLPESRLAGLLEAARFLDHSENALTTRYYESLASAMARIADVGALGNVLRRLPPGRALLVAIDAICLDRPEFIATYVWHPEFHAEGAAALLRLASTTSQRKGSTCSTSSGPRAVPPSTSGPSTAARCCVTSRSPAEGGELDRRAPGRPGSPA